jgi:hypothetical protein
MKYICAFWAAILLFAVPAYGQRLTGNQPSMQTVQSNLSAMPLSFTENRGQWDEKALFRAEAGGATFWYCKDEVVYQFTRDTDRLIEGGIPHGPNMLGMMPDKFDGPRYKKETMLIRAQFVGANPSPDIKGEDRLSYNGNYFYGNDPSKWRTDVPNWSSVIYKDIYPGIDLKYHGDGQGIKYDFIVNPGADLSQIKIKYDGAENLSVTNLGDLEAQTKFGPVYERIPQIYQEISGQKRVVTGHYTLQESGVFGFDLEYGFDPAYPVDIDPELIYSTYLGGSDGDFGQGIAVDSSGNVYVMGTTGSSNFPTATPYDPTYNGGLDDVFATKLSSTGNSLVYSTYLGGTDFDKGWAIAVDDSGSAYLTGQTQSINFPTHNAYDGSFNGGIDVFVTKLSSQGDSLVYSTYLGGSDYEYGYGIAVDGSRNAYVTGNTYSTNFPTQNPYQTYQGPANSADAFATKFSASGTSLIYSTYLGGNGYDAGWGIAVDSSDNAYVAGSTGSSNFPTQNPYQTSQGGGDAFVTKLSTSGNSLVYSTYLGGSDGDFGLSIAVDGSGSAYVTGKTRSANFPTLNPYQAYQGPTGYADVFVTKLSPTGNSLVYSTYLGGNDSDEGYGIAVDGSGNADVIGFTYSTNFPMVNSYDGSYNGDIDAFFAKLSSGGDSLTYSTYLGGNLTDEGYGVAVDSSGNSYVTGVTLSADFPTVSPYDGSHNGNGDVFIVKLGPAGSIWGIVTESDGSTPIGGVLIKSLQNGSEIARDTTALSGLYILANLLPGFYDVEASKVGYVSQTRQQIEVIAGQTDTLNFLLVQEIPPCSYVPGDINGNSQVNGVDIIYGVNYLKGGQHPPTDCGGICPEPSPFYAAGDVNGNCAFNGIDITFFVRYLKGQVPSLLNCPDCPPARMNPPAPAVEPIRAPVLKTPMKNKPSRLD